MTDSVDDELELDEADEPGSATSLRDRRRTRRMRRALRVPVDEVPRPASAPREGPSSSGEVTAEAAPAERPTRTSVVAARIVTIGPPTVPEVKQAPSVPMTESGDELDVDLDVEPIAEPPPAQSLPRHVVAPPPPPDGASPGRLAEDVRSIEVPLDPDEIDTIPPAAERPPPPAGPIPAAAPVPAEAAAWEAEVARPSAPDLTDVLVEDDGKPTPIPDVAEVRPRPVTPPPPPRPPSIPPPSPLSVTTNRGSAPPPPPAPVAAAVPVLSEALLGDSTPPPAGGPPSQTSASGAIAAAPASASAQPVVAPPPPGPPAPTATPTAPLGGSAAAAPAPAATPHPAPEAARSASASSFDTSDLEHPRADGVEAEETPTIRRKRKKRHRPWWDEFFNDDYLRTFVPPTDEQTRRQVDFVDDSLGLTPGSAVLDLACGLGLHAVEMAARGYKVVGLDLSIPMLATAGDTAQERGVKINFIHGDMRELAFDSAFDGIYCFDTSFGFFDDDTNRDVLARVHQALKPMGMFLLDVVNRDFVMRHQPNLVWFEGDGCVCMEETDMNYITSRLHVKRTIILEDGRQKQSEYSVRLYSLHELGQLLHNLGFRVAEVSGRIATPGVYFGAESPRLVILAEKRAADVAGPPTGTLVAPPEPSSSPTPSPPPDAPAPEPENQ